MAVVAVFGHGPVQLGFVLYPFRQRAFGPFIQHADQRPDDFEVAQLFGRDIHQHIFTARIVITQALGEVAAGGRQFTLRPAKLFQQKIGEAGIRFSNANRVLQLFDVSKHTLSCGLFFRFDT